MVNSQIKVGAQEIAPSYPTYFIADIAANHDGDLQRAKDLIRRCADAGADAAKFQHFAARSIVSDHGFRSLGGQWSHQASWSKSVYEVYSDASLRVDWTAELKATCDEAGVAFMTSPYSFELVDEVDPHIAAYKIGSGDLTWIDLIKYIASKGKPYMIATGASSADDVHRAVSAALEVNPALVLMQCNTNYTASLENFRYIQLNVLQTYAAMYPGLVLGLSDHTPGSATVLGAIALGARVIEKHFTDDVTRTGPDHKFSMDPRTWKEMVLRSRELENALGCGVKKIEKNEAETVVLQRRAIRLKNALKAGSKVEATMIEMLRPCPSDALPPFMWEQVQGKQLRRDLEAGEYVKWSDLM